MLHYVQLVVLTKTTAAGTPTAAGKLRALDVSAQEDHGEECRCWISTGLPSASKQSRHRPRQTDCLCHLPAAKLVMDEESEQDCQEMLEEKLHEQKTSNVLLMLKRSFSHFPSMAFSVPRQQILCTTPDYSHCGPQVCLVMKAAHCVRWFLETLYKYLQK